MAFTYNTAGLLSCLQFLAWGKIDCTRYVVHFEPFNDVAPVEGQSLRYIHRAIDVQEEATIAHSSPKDPEQREPAAERYLATAGIAAGLGCTGEIWRLLEAQIYPSAYKLSPYAGMDVERTYCDAHAGFGKEDASRIPGLLSRGIMLALWSDQPAESPPTLLWTVDESGWIFELRITNAEQALYHGYPLLPEDAFARHVLVRARNVAFAENASPSETDPGVQAAIAAAEIFYR